MLAFFIVCSVLNKELNNPADCFYTQTGGVHLSGSKMPSDKCLLVRATDAGNFATLWALAPLCDYFNSVRWASFHSAQPTFTTRHIPSISLLATLLTMSESRTRMQRPHWPRLKLGPRKAIPEQARMSRTASLV